MNPLLLFLISLVGTTAGMSLVIHSNISSVGKFGVCFLLICGPLGLLKESIEFYGGR